MLKWQFSRRHDIFRKCLQFFKNVHFLVRFCPILWTMWITWGIIAKCRLFEISDVENFSTLEHAFSVDNVDNSESEHIFC